MSGIKIFRSFVKFITMNLPSYHIETEHQMLQVTKFNGELYKYDLAINPYNEYSQLQLVIDSFSDDSFVIVDSNRIVIHDLNEFLETDDISLILRYGRCILDSSILDSLNKIYGFGLTIDNFKDLIELDEINE